MKRQPTTFFYGWLIVAAGMVTYGLGYGARYSFSVIFPSLLEDFGWPRDLTATMFSAHMLVYGLVAPVAGGLVDRFGPRRTMVTGTLILALGLGLSAAGHRPWHFWASFGVLFGTGLCLIGAIPFSMVLRNWFEKKRGLAFSLLYLGSGLAYAWYPLTAYIIESKGWRAAFLVEAVSISVLLLPLFILVIRYRPEDKGTVRDGEREECEGPRQSGPMETLVADPTWAGTDWTLGKAVRTRRFWLLCLTTFSFWGIMQHIVIAHHVAFATDLGYSKTHVSSVLSLMGVTFLLGSLAGSVSDRIGREPTLTVAIVVGTSGVVALLFMRDAAHPWLLWFHALAFGFGNGMGAPAIVAAATDLFQGARVGPTLGFVWLSFAVGGCMGPWLGGWLFELTGGYGFAFAIAVGWNLVACAALWGAGPRNVRRVPGRA